MDAGCSSSEHQLRLSFCLVVLQPLRSYPIFVRSVSEALSWSYTPVPGTLVPRTILYRSTSTYIRTYIHKVYIILRCRFWLCSCLLLAGTYVLGERQSTGQRCNAGRQKVECTLSLCCADVGVGALPLEGLPQRFVSTHHIYMCTQKHRNNCSHVWLGYRALRVYEISTANHVRACKYCTSVLFFEKILKSYQLYSKIDEAQSGENSFL